MKKLCLSFFCLFLIFASLANADEFRFRIQEDLGHLDWNQGEIAPLVVLQLMEGLTSTDTNGKTQPGLAQSWKQIHKSRKGGPGWIFRIRKNAVWSDGKPVCAQDFIDSWQRLLSPQLASPFAHYLFFIKNAEAFHKNNASLKDLGLEARNCQELKVTLQDSLGYFPQITSHWVTFPIRKDLITKYPQQWYLPQNLVVTGPYLLKEWRRDQSYSFQWNSRYWNQHPHIDNLKALVINDDQTALNVFRSGKLHWMKDLPLQERKNLSHEVGFRKDPALVGYFLGFNVNTPPFNDQNLRCALASSLNKSEIPQILEGAEIPADTWVPFVLGGPKSGIKESFNLKLAKKLLTRSMSASAAKTQLTLNLHYYIKDIHTPVMQWIQSQWKTNLGIQVELHPTEGKSYWGRLNQSPPGLFLSGTTAWFSHPYAFLSELSSSSHANWGHYQSQSYNKIINEVKLQSLPNAKLLSQAQEILLHKDCAMIPLYFRSTLSLTNSQCTPLVVNPLTYVYFKNAHCKNLP